MSNRARYAVVAIALSSACSSRTSEPPAQVQADVLAPLRAIPELSAALVRATKLRPTGDRLLLDPPAISPSRFVQPSGFSASLPAHADAPIRVSAGDDVWLEIKAVGRADAPARIVERSVVFAAAEPHVDVVLIGEATRVEELRILRDEGASAVARYRLTKGPGIAKLRLRHGIVEALDARGNARLRSDPVVAWDADGGSVPVSVSLHDDELMVRAEPIGHRHPIVVDPAFGGTGGLTFARRAFTTTTLSDGRILVAGGETSTTILSTAEIYDPATGSFTLAASMTMPRVRHVAVASPGTVFVTGGSNTTGVLSASELYTEVTDTWVSKAPNPVTVTEAVAARAASNGKILVALGHDGPTVDGSGRLWDPTTNTWSTVPGTIVARFGASSAVLSGTKILLCGGVATTACSQPSKVCDIYEATTNTWATASPMITERMSFPLVPMAGGLFLAAGGAYNNCNTSTNSAEYYDASQNTWTALPTMAQNRYGNGAAAINAGAAVVVFGGIGTGLQTAQIFDLGTKTWSASMPLGSERAYAGAATVANGMIAIGGSNTDNTLVTPTVERYGAAMPLGTTCGSAGGWCASGFCIEGVCCDRRCDQPCESCSAVGSVGTCKTILGAPVPGKSCAGTGSCKSTCAGSATCTFPTSATACVPASCSGDIAQPAAYCDGAGNCGAAPATIACAPFACGATGCKTTCVVDADCISTLYCNAGTCVPKKAPAATCTTSGQCGTGFCADGVCCDEACTATCKACNLDGSQGVCTDETLCSDGGVTDVGVTTDSAVDPDGATVADTAISDTSTTAADTSTTAVDTGTVPTDTSSGPVDTGAAPTDSGLGVAETPAPQLPATPLVAGEFQRCTKASQCSTGFCVDGVCCDSACDDKCHTCALLSSPGKCTMAPIGVDLRNDCGPANQCLGTCGGGGECIGSGNGTMCGRNRCIGASKGVGPAYCPAPGAKCALEQAVPFDCMPYACEPAFGACLTVCSSTDDCANGFVCDTPTRACVAFAAPPVEEDSGCSYGGSRKGNAAFAVFALAALAMRRRRTAMA